MKKINLIKKLEEYAVFNLKTLKQIIEKDSNYSKLVIYRLKKDRLILEIEKNKYTVNKDALIVASNIIWPCYISFWSALRYHNFTEQLPQVIEVITTRARKKREIKFSNTKIIFTRIKPKYFFGYKKEKHQNFNIFIADKEKALLDSALFKKVSFSEICSIVKDNINEVDKELIVGYLIKIRNKALAKRFGFLLDRLGINKSKELRKFIDYKYVPLDYSLKAKGVKNKQWKVIDNVGF